LSNLAGGIRAAKQMIMIRLSRVASFGRQIDSANGVGNAVEKVRGPMGTIAEFLRLLEMPPTVDNREPG
jgi:hypothetical protein